MAGTVQPALWPACLPAALGRASPGVAPPPAAGQLPPSLAHTPIPSDCVLPSSVHLQEEQPRLARGEASSSSSSSLAGSESLRQGQKERGGESWSLRSRWGREAGERRQGAHDPPPPPSPVCPPESPTPLWPMSCGGGSNRSTRSLAPRWRTPQLTRMLGARAPPAPTPAHYCPWHLSSTSEVASIPQAII